MINKYPRRLAVNRAAGHGRVTITRPGGGAHEWMIFVRDQHVRAGFSVTESVWQAKIRTPAEPAATRFLVSPDDGKGNRGITIRLPHLDRLDIRDGADEH